MSKLNIVKHLIEHQILKVSSGGSGGGIDNPIHIIGSWDANTNTPDLSVLSPSEGTAYVVSTAGSTNLNGETNWKAKDLAVFYNSTNWFKIDNTDDVISVNNKTGIVSLNLEDVRNINNQIAGPIDANSNNIENLPNPTNNGNPLIYGNEDDVFFYETNRGKKLSINILQFRYGRNSGNVSSSQYLRTINGMQTNQNSDILPYNMTLIGCIISRNGTSNDYTLNIQKNNDNTTNIYSQTVLSPNIYKKDMSLNIDFNENDLLNIQIVPNGSISYPYIQLFFRRRA